MRLDGQSDAAQLSGTRDHLSNTSCHRTNTTTHSNDCCRPIACSNLFPITQWQAQSARESSVMPFSTRSWSLWSFSGYASNRCGVFQVAVARHCVATALLPVKQRKVCYQSLPSQRHAPLVQNDAKNYRCREDLANEDCYLR